MTIWVLGLVLLASLAGFGWRQGAIKVAISFLGIVVGAALAAPLGHPLGRMLRFVGVKDPLLTWALGPLIVFIIFSVIAKVVAAAVHHKADVHYKYHSGELRMALWERLNHRVGLCLGLLNGAAYFILISFVIYLMSYVTVQFATSDTDPKWMRLVNMLGRDLHKTGFAKVARSIDSVPQANFQMADLGALVYHNPLLEARVINYPGFLDLGEQPEFQNLGADKEFTQAWTGSEPVMSLLENPRLHAIRENPDLLRTIWSTVETNLDDVRTYLTTGQSPRYDSITILGRWKYDPNLALNAIRRAKPNISSLEMQRLRRIMEGAFSKTELVVKPDNQITLKNAPALKFSPANVPIPAPGPNGAVVPQPPPQVQTVQGQWKDAGGKYLLTIANQDLPTTVEGDRLDMKADSSDWVFARED
jgi:uncharacterized membrane protein required for colicin V production